MKPSLQIKAAVIMPRPSTADIETLRMENGRLNLELEKLAQELKPKSAPANKDEGLWSKLSNPLVLAIVGGFVTIMTGMATSAYTSYQTRALEELKAKLARESASETFQSELIKKFVEGPSIAAVRENLKFLAHAGLIPNFKDPIQKYLDENPDSAPQLGFLVGITGTDDAAEVTSLPEANPLKSKSISIGRLMNDAGTNFCTGFLIAQDLVATAGHCISINDQFSFVLGEYRSKLTLVTKHMDGIGTQNYAVLRLSSPAPSQYNALTVSFAPLQVGESLSIVMFRGSNKQLVVSGRDCRIVSIDKNTFNHHCDTGAGTSGAPIFSIDGLVVGIHGGRNEFGGWATFANVLQSFVQPG